LTELTAHRQRSSVDLEQTDLFEQYVSVLERLAARNPLLITLDDLQWADTGSISLLFHLGRRIEGSSILVVGAYRPEETSLGWDGSRHPLQKVLGESRRTFGDNQVDLAPAEERDGRRFVDVFLDTQPNLLNEEFRRSLFRQTGGHPLFTVELLRAMQARGDLVQDEAMRWMAGPALDWGILPARVEAVIEERIGRLDARLHGMLSVASVEGELFTAEVVARVQGLSELQTLRHLSQELSKRHRLVREVEEVSVAHQPLTRYQFSHILFQRYLYEDMASGERRHLHAEIAQALEELYEGRTEEMAAQLLHHFREAEVQEKAVEYARLAARRAVAVYAYEEAIQYLQIALDLLENGEQDETRLALLEELADVYRLLRHGAEAFSHFQAALEQWSSLTGADDMIAVRLHRKIVHTISELRWHAEFEQFEALSQTLATSRAYLESSLVLAEDEPPQLEWVLVLDALATETGIELSLPFDLDAAESYAQAAVEMAEELDAPLAISDALGTLAEIQLTRGWVSQYLEVSYRRLAISQDPRFSDVRKRIVILDDLGTALILAGEYHRAMPYLVEAESLAAQIGAVDLQISALNLQATCWFRLDRWDEVLDVDEKRQELEQRNSRERIGPSCIEVSVCAATLALRGDFDLARVLREQAYAIQVHLSGDPSPAWVRVHYY
jgi:tetratricopeptide (TPR) repeat protein